MFTVLYGISASGNYIPPFTIYKGAHLYESWTKGGPPGALYACTESGWMQDSVFESWMDHFIKYTESLQKPVLLIYDGHGSHMTYGTVKKAIDNNIIILCLPPHTSHALQPLDVGVFSPVKEAWKQILKKLFRESRLQNVSKSVFPSLLKQLFECLRPQNAIKSFLGSGLYPINIHEVEKRIVLTETSGVLLSSDQEINLNQNSEPSTSVTCNLDFKQTDTSSNFNTTIASPLKDLKQAILTTLSPPMSEGNRMARDNSKGKRKRVQAKTGEVLTEEIVALRLQKEQEERDIKKLLLKDQSGKKQKIARKRKIIPSQQFPLNQFMTAKDIQISQTISVGSWVMVKYEGKKPIKQFIGQVIDQNGDLLSVKYLKKSKIGNYYTFPESDDTDEIEKSSVIKILEEPNFDNRGHYKFTL